MYYLSSSLVLSVSENTTIMQKWEKIEKIYEKWEDYNAEVCASAT